MRRATDSSHVRPGAIGTGPPAWVDLASSDLVAWHVRQMILDGRLQAGMRVPQDDIADELGMSRLPVREALISLEREGWVEIRRRRGAFVLALDRQLVHDHYELYGFIFGMAVRYAIRRGAPVFADRLSTLLHGVDAAVDDPAAYNAAVRAFYDAIVEAAASRPVEVTLASLRSLVPNDFFEVIPDAIPVERNALATIASAVGRRDEDAAAEALAEVSAAISKLVVALFEERGLFDTPTSTPADQPDVAG